MVLVSEKKSVSFHAIWCVKYWCIVYNWVVMVLLLYTLAHTKKNTLVFKPKTEVLYMYMDFCIKITIILVMIKFCFFFWLKCWFKRRRKRARDQHNHIQTTDKNTRWSAMYMLNHTPKCTNTDALIHLRGKKNEYNITKYTQTWR